MQTKVVGVLAHSSEREGVLSGNTLRMADVEVLNFIFPAEDRSKEVSLAFWGLYCLR